MRRSCEEGVEGGNMYGSGNRVGLPVNIENMPPTRDGNAKVQKIYGGSTHLESELKSPLKLNLPHSFDSISPIGPYTKV